MPVMAELEQMREVGKGGAGGIPFENSMRRSREAKVESRKECNVNSSLYYGSLDHTRMKRL